MNSNLIGCCIGSCWNLWPVFVIHLSMGYVSEPQAKAVECETHLDQNHDIRKTAISENNHASYIRTKRRLKLEPLKFERVRVFLQKWCRHKPYSHCLTISSEIFVVTESSRDLLTCPVARTSFLFRTDDIFFFVQSLHSHASQPINANIPTPHAILNNSMISKWHDLWVGGRWEQPQYCRYLCWHNRSPPATRSRTKGLTVDLPEKK